MRAGGAPHRRQRLRDAAAAEAACSSAPTSSVYSATKHIDGQGRSLGGAVLGSRKFVTESLVPFLRHTGPAFSPFNAWLLLKGLETLELRVEQQMARRARDRAPSSRGIRKVARTLYPGLESHPQYALARRQMSGAGTVVTFEVGRRQGGARSASCNALQARRDLEQSGRQQEPRHPSRDDDASARRAGRSARRSASPTRWCGSRSGSRTRPT